jgi:hypothetical protein
MIRAFRYGVLLMLAGCETPPVFATADVRQNDSSAHIEGNVVATSSARGNVVLFLYDASRPPPPTGNGRPLNFATIQRETLFGGQGGNGPFVAPFALSLVTPGKDLIRGIIDTNADFIPWYTVTADANAGDVGGAAIDPLTRGPKVIDVERAAKDVTVTFSDVATVPVDRPSFRVDTEEQSATLTRGTTLTVDLLPQPIRMGVIRQNQMAFLARLADDDRDGVADDKNNDGVPDGWPKVIVRKIGEGETLLRDDSGDYTHVVASSAVDPDGVPDVVVLQAGVDLTEHMQLLTGSDGKPLPTPVPVSKLKLVSRPVAVDARIPDMPVPLLTVPSGNYAIILISETGQTWRVPNELAVGFGSALGLPEVMSQGFFITVPR